MDRQEGAGALRSICIPTDTRAATNRAWLSFQLELGKGPKPNRGLEVARIQQGHSVSLNVGAHLASTFFKLSAT